MVDNFDSTFPSFTGSSVKPDVDKLKGHFLNYDASEWTSEGGGSLSSISTEGIESSIVVIQNNKLGVLLLLSFFDKDRKQYLSEYFSVSDFAKINQIEDIGDDEFYPIGSFMPPANAWLAVEDFFQDPTKKSNRIDWIEANEIKWPDSLG